MSEEFDFDKYSELIKGINQLAVAVSEYYRALLKEGMSDQNALYLAGRWQADIIMTGGKGGEK